MTRVYAASDERGLADAVACLRAGRSVAFPTDTVYGVGCDLWDPAAIEHLYWVKQRPRDLAIPVLVASPEDVERVATGLDARFARLVERFWPGGLTVVVPRAPAVPEILSAGRATVAVRMPDHPLALRLIRGLGGALAATSANLSGRPSPSEAAMVLADLGGRIAVLLDGGACPGGVASTIVSLAGPSPELLRQGAIPLGALEERLPGLSVAGR